MVRIGVIRVGPDRAMRLNGISGQSDDGTHLAPEIHRR